MNKVFKEFKHMLSSDKSDKFSSKRVITFSAFILIAIAFVANMGWGVTIDPTILNGMIQIVWAGLGMVMGEHLLRRRHDNNLYEDELHNHNQGGYPVGHDPYDQEDPYRRGPYDEGDPDELGDN